MKKKRTIKKYKKLIGKVDPFYNSYWIGKFFNKFMKMGKKHLIEHTILKCFQNIQKETNIQVLYFFFTVLTKFRPLFGFISKRFGKQFKKIPVPLYPRRQIITSLKWLVLSIQINHLSSFEDRLVSEFLDLNAKKKTSLWKRYTDHLQEVNENRLNHRFRWK